MTNAPLKLPPFRALLAFWAAATHDRLSEAATRLGVTESAVSHQLRHLERTLNVQLFDRSGGRLSLTQLGERYLARIEPALRELQAATAALQPSTGRQTVRLTLPPSLAATWLIPRLGPFEAAHPEVDLQLVLTTRLVDLVRDHIDLAIRYGKGSWPGMQATLLFGDLATPVATPGLVPEGAAFDALPEGTRFLVNRTIPGEWDEWARAREMPTPDAATTLMLDSIEQVLQVALAGHGIAMGRSPYIEPHLESGRLVTPFGAAGPTGAAYYLCQPAETAPTAPARKLAAWLEDAGASFSAVEDSKSST